jgi:hypothetical protein
VYGGAGAAGLFEIVPIEGGGFSWAALTELFALASDHQGGMHYPALPNTAAVSNAGGLGIITA